MEILPIKLEQYAPDLDPMVPGRITALTSMTPSLRGWDGAPVPRSQGIAALAAQCRGAALIEKIDGSRRLFAGSATKLYELAGTTWTDRTRAVGGDYVLGTTNRWSFAQFGDVTLAAAKSDILQFSTAAAFANAAANAPKASIVETVGNFVFLFDVNDQASLGPYGDNAQRWWCAAIGSYTDWVPSIATQCATATLQSTAGGIKGAKRFGTSIMAYKERSMFQGVYVGQPQIWDFREIQGEAGAIGNDAIINIGTPENPMHIFMGSDDFYIYDGSRPLPIGHGIKNQVYSEIDRAYGNQVQGLHDSINKRVYFFYPVSGATIPEKCVCYNYQTGKWGRADRAVEAVVQFAPSSITYDALGASYTTYSDLPLLGYDTAFATSSIYLPGIFDNTHTLKTLDGASVGGTMTLGDLGDTQRLTTLSRVIPRWLTRPSSSDMTNFYRMFGGDALTSDMVTPLSNGRYDSMREARWHRLSFSYSGPVELAELDVEFIPGGEE